MVKRLLKYAVPLVARMGGGAAALPTYAEILRDTYGASEIYPLTNIASGTDIHAFVNGAHDGTLTLGGGALQDAAGPVLGTLAPHFDGSTGHWDIASIGLAFDGGIGSFFCFCKVNDASVWTDGASHYIAVLQADANNRILINKSSTNNLIQVLYYSGGASQGRNITPVSTTDWFMVGVTWKDSANGNSVVVYLNGVQQGAALTGFGAWSGALTQGRLASISPNTFVWNGWFAYAGFKFGSIWSPTDIANIYADRLTGGPDVNP